MKALSFPLKPERFLTVYSTYIPSKDLMRKYGRVAISAQIFSSSKLRQKLDFLFTNHFFPKKRVYDEVNNVYIFYGFCSSFEELENPSLAPLYQVTFIEKKGVLTNIQISKVVKRKNFKF